PDRSHVHVGLRPLKRSFCHDDFLLETVLLENPAPEVPALCQLTASVNSGISRLGTSPSV
ncbi:hypothetical protein, partial [Deinococcus ruber]|uniref:hypothetical protein n=1 Tax=Deinococcus ruber TaxID=1848197 RepID=UPI001E2B968A